MKTLSNIADRQEILSRITNLSERDRALWGKMTANEILCHLSDCYLPIADRTLWRSCGMHPFSLRETTLSIRASKLA